MAWFWFIVSQLAGAMVAFWFWGSGWHALVGALAGCWLAWLYVSWQHARFFRWTKEEGLAPRHFYGSWANLQYFWRKQQRKHQFREERQQRTLEELRMAIQASPNGVVLLTGRDWTIEWFNNMASGHLGLDLTKDFGHNLLSLVRDPDFSNYCAVGDFRETLEIDGRSSVSGSPRLAIQIFPYDEEKCLLLTRDITQVQRTEAMRRDFIANVSHEIRTPLTIFAGYVETLQSLPLQEEERRQYYQRMEQQTSRMQLLVADLLSLSMLEGSPLPNLCEVLDIGALLAYCMNEALALSASLAGKANGPAHHIRLFYTPAGGPAMQLAMPGKLIPEANESADTTPPESSWPVNMGTLAGSEKELHSAFSNIIANAVRYTPAGGAIDLLWSWDKGGSASFEVRDTGPGIASEHLSRLTERFYRVDRSRSRETGGTGLGLAIVKHVVHRHGGHLHIESVLGKGSVFRIDMPSTRLKTPEAVQAQQEKQRLKERALQA